jgi:hypothetical protein
VLPYSGLATILGSRVFDIVKQQIRAARRAVAVCATPVFFLIFTGAALAALPLASAARGPWRGFRKTVGETRLLSTFIDLARGAKRGNPSALAQLRRLKLARSGG